MKHYYSEILTAIAEGKPIQIYTGIGWADANSNLVLTEIARDTPTSTKVFRVKPPTIVVNGFECPSEAAYPDRSGFYGITITLQNVGCRELWYETEEDAATVFNAILAPFPIND